MTRIHILVYTLNQNEMKRILFLFLTIGMGLQSIGQSISEDIRLNQIGFLPAAQKYAVVIGSSATTFEIWYNGHQVVYEGELTNSATWSASQESVRIADFTAYDALGTFQVHIPGL